MATRERGLREVAGARLGLRGALFGGSSAVVVLDKPEPELEPEKEDVRAPNMTSEHPKRGKPTDLKESTPDT